MKEKIKGVLQTGWNEPRHFFFWLTMFSLLGLIGIAAGLEASPTSFFTGGEARPLLTVFACVALGFLLGVLVGIPAFILAWIPPVRRLLARGLGQRWLVLGSLVTLAALFYAVEDWRGRHAWLSYKRDREAKGERFDWASLAPPPVPKEQNFFESPLWDDLHFTKTNGTTVWQNPNFSSRIVFSPYGPRAESVPSFRNWVHAQRVDLAAWQGFYRGASNTILTALLSEQAQQAKRFRERYGARYGLKPASGSTVTSNALTISSSPAAHARAATNLREDYFPIAKEPQSPAADVLLALSRFETNRQLLIASAARPQARFWINYEDGFGLLVPHLARVKACTEYLSLHANAALKAGDEATALEDIRLLFRLIEALRREPIIISQLVGIAVLHIGLQPVWEGLADRQWTEADLNILEGELGKLDFLADYRFAMRGERACQVWGVDCYRRLGLSGLNEPVAPDDSSNTAAVERVVGRMLLQLVPAGWADQNKLSLCRTGERYLLPAVDEERRLVLPAVTRQLQSDADQLRVRPYDMLSKNLLPALDRTAEGFARAQTTVDLARIACALERYRLANGQFPATLQALAPKFIETLPHDVINGQPLKYRRTDDGQFVLYSVGWDEKDDGGQVALTKAGNPDISKGDWVWRYPAR
jgi:hypothetical protein